MKPDYKNWMPKGMILSFAAGAAASLFLCLLFACSGWVSGSWQRVLIILFVVLAVVFCGLTIWSVLMYRTFDYSGRRQMSRLIIEGVAAYIKLPQGGKCLDVGCGSGALAIAVAKRNPKASVVGIDRWGKEYASFSKTLCERNAQAEKVKNTSFQQGDAKHLDFPDDSFDAVTSNYVYHNIMGRNKQQLLLETLRVLKKGGAFAIHDIMSRQRYGDMNEFMKELRLMGYEKVKLIDTTDGKFMSRAEAATMLLTGSAILCGVK